MAPDYDALVAWLREAYGDRLRWVASFDHGRFSHRVRFVRDDLKTELTEQQLDVVVHRSLAVFNRDHVEDVYAHLGPARALVVEHERATAIHVYLDDEQGVVVKLEPAATVEVPGFAADCRDRLGA
ncbi:hypothetical protein [Halorarius halobius]|uniref:hypothetical protein n=1 Tax=Halorarius halobius TaxID=2962671 RepID=UPI0020CCCDDA|nr:hypothetical protein [Halorarius halobius]